MSVDSSSDSGELEAVASFRKESLLDPEGMDAIDLDLCGVLEQLRRLHPDCDRLGEVNAALDYCRDQLKAIMEGEQEPERKQAFMDKIVQFGLEKQLIEDSQSASSVFRVHGHELVLQSARGRHNPYCEVCMHTIWRIVQSWRRCAVCGFRAHEKCCNNIHRICAGVIASRPEFSLITAFPVEHGLMAQNYSCAECCCALSYDGPSIQEPRLCEYTGLLFCPNCHWGDKWSIPARILHNMDATPRPICRSVKQLLALVDNKPLINMSQADSALFKYHSDLKRVQRIRRDFLYMKCYFISCRTAKKLRILQYLNRHTHFVENSDIYSLKELRDLCNGNLLQDLEDIHMVFKRHIEEECEICRGNGFFCELCRESQLRDEIIFPFTEGTTSCGSCCAVFHSKCFERNSLHCTRCERRRKRATANEPDSEHETSSSA